MTRGVPPLQATEGMEIEGGQTVGPKCDDKTAPGWWYCITHQSGFPSGLATWGHWDEPGDHVAAWICSAHGPEVP